MQFEHAPPEALQLLPVRIRDLGLSLDSSPVAELVRHLYAELEEKGLKHFRPSCYLSDEWGSPTGEPVIGIPFYLADPRVANLEDAVNDVEDEREIMMYLRHEAGHAFNHAYELSLTREWRKLFGNTRRPYRDDFRFVPFSREFVRYIPGWYAQKHPDEDFAETFAVWLDPQSPWASRYAGWEAMKKLQYVDRIVRELGNVAPVKAVGKTDVTVAEMEQTVEEFYAEFQVDESPLVADLALDADLLDIFPHATDEETRSAALLLREHRRTVIDKVNYWTGVRRTLVRTLVIAIEKRLTALELVAVRERARQQMVELTVYITTLAMSFLLGKRRLKHRRPTR
jgi:hypothetical protein